MALSSSGINAPFLDPPSSASSYSSNTESLFSTLPTAPQISMLSGRTGSRGRLNNLVPLETSGRTIFIDDNNFSVESDPAGPITLSTAAAPSMTDTSLPTEDVLRQMSSVDLNAGAAHEILDEPLPEGITVSYGIILATLCNG